MCRRVTCSKCGKPSFTGCGMHVDSVLGDVAPAARCRCRETNASAAADSGGANKGWRRLLDCVAGGRERSRP